METREIKQLDGNLYLNLPPFYLYTWNEKEEEMTLWAREPIIVGDELTISRFKINHPPQLNFKVIEILENRDHKGWIDITDVKKEKGKPAQYTYKEDKIKKTKSFYRIRVQSI